MPSPLPSIHYRSVERDNERNIKKERKERKKDIQEKRKKERNQKRRVRVCFTFPSSDVERLRETERAR